MGSLSKPFHSFDFGADEVCCVSFSPYEWSKNFLAIGTKNKVAVATVQLEKDELDLSLICEFHHPCPVVSIAWGPTSSSDTIPRICKFATAGTDGKIRLYSSNLNTSEDVLVLEGHTDNVNSVTFDPEVEERYILSTSDDYTCKVWSTSTGELLHNIPLTSPGMVVKFNVTEPSKFFVLEKSGLIRIFSMQRFLPLTSIYSNHANQDPSLDADWSSTNPSHLVTSQGNRILHWNLSHISFPDEVLTVGGENVDKVKFHPTLTNYVAVLSSPGPVVTVFQNTGPTLLTEPLVAATDLSWHYHLPLLAVANDRTVKFWKILLK